MFPLAFFIVIFFEALRKDGAMEIQLFKFPPSFEVTLWLILFLGETARQPTRRELVWNHVQTAIGVEKPPPKKKKNL